jgi:hypothetical protein
LPNFQVLTEEKYPSKSRPEEEGKSGFSPFIPLIAVETYMCAAVLEVTIGIPSASTDSQPQSIAERRRPGRCSRATTTEFAVLCSSLMALGLNERLSK